MILNYFNGIIPCGIKDFDVTSLKELAIDTSFEEIVKKAIEQNGEFANLYLMMGLIHHFQSNFLEAINHLRKALDINPKYTEAAMALSVTLCDLGQYEKGCDVFETLNKTPNSSALQIRGVIANTHAENGKNYQKLGDQNEAILEFKKALNLFPNMPDVKLDLAKLYLEMDQLDHASQQLQEILAMEDDFVEARTLLGIVQFKKGFVRDARDHWLKSQQLNPSDKVSRAYLRLSESA